MLCKYNISSNSVPNHPERSSCRASIRECLSTWSTISVIFMSLRFICISLPSSATLDQYAFSNFESNSILNLISNKGVAVLSLGRSVVVIFTLFLASAGIIEMKTLAAFARFEKGLNLVVISVRYLVIILSIVESLL